jgi:purine-cytosine permease-like protein
VWQGTDLVVAVTVSWIPLAADYTRFSRSPRSAFWGAGVGYLIPDVLLLSLGAVIVFTRGVTDAAELPAAVAAGGLAAFVALLALTVAETDEAFANAYSGAVSGQNLFPWLPQRGLVVVTTSLGVLGALTIDLLSFQTFLFLLGSLFVPLFGVLLADWLVAGRRYDEDDVFGAPAWRAGMVAVWVVGFAVYQWLAPTGPAWWVDLVERLDPPAWGIGATLPSFALTLAAGVAVAATSRRAGLRAVRT